MKGNAVWLADVLRAAGLTVHERAGWKTRGRREMGNVRGIICHHTATKNPANAPSVGIVESGRADLAGPLAHIVLARDGTWIIIAAGRCNHAGAGKWQGVVDANGEMIGIEAENAGDGSEIWPEIQLDSYERGCAAILKHIGADDVMCGGHYEYALPRGRKVDPNFDMVRFREEVAEHMAGGGSIYHPKPAPIDVTRLMLRKGSQGESVKILQRKLNIVDDGDFGPATERALKAFQKQRGLVDDGRAGPKTWAALGF